MAGRHGLVGAQALGGERLQSPPCSTRLEDLTDLLSIAVERSLAGPQNSSLHDAHPILGETPTRRSPNSGRNAVLARPRFFECV
jgi:hypothetical protein